MDFLLYRYLSDIIVAAQLMVALLVIIDFYFTFVIKPFNFYECPSVCL